MRASADSPAIASRAFGRLGVALSAAVLILGWQALAVQYVYDGNWTALFCTGDYFPIPPRFQQGTYVFFPARRVTMRPFTAILPTTRCFAKACES